MSDDKIGVCRYNAVSQWLHHLRWEQSRKHTNPGTQYWRERVAYLFGIWEYAKCPTS